MSYRIENPESYQGKVVDNGECVRFVQSLARMPQTKNWSPGQYVKTASYIAPGTVIATFVDGHYPKDDHGKHAAVYIRHDDFGIDVWDQSAGHPVARRTIRYKEGDQYRSNDGDTFYVVE
ncbi:BPSL0067 family protein [Chondromyces apiculatus]|uniref:BPSL0067 family protein n=1 Tax=Chondromyces apiculatus DSM 436 TaxID=1192034 RepID=A0A017TBF1_9BACT|nr:BPSL0067 family protein [Chondromyces apiculatus]EYF06150.1 Hypothetical protein CAP_2340 [Chondromyces apiculatus DSM 436]